MKTTNAADTLERIVQDWIKRADECLTRESARMVMWCVEDLNNALANLAERQGEAARPISEERYQEALDAYEDAYEFTDSHCEGIASVIKTILKWREDPAPAAGADARKVLEDLLEHVDVETCTHEETHRGGVLWTICDDCGRDWADDCGGFQPHQDAPAVAAARAYIAALQNGAKE